MGGNEDATGIIYICGSHSPPPRPDHTTHAMLPALQRQDDPTTSVSHHTRLTGCHSHGDGHERPLPAPKLQKVSRPEQGQKVPQQISAQPLLKEPFVLRFHPEGGSFTQGGNGCLKGLPYTQDAYIAKNTLAQYTAEIMPTHYGEFTAQECGRIAEFLALYPWTEPRHGLPLTQSGKEQHLLLHDNTSAISS